MLLSRVSRRQLNNRVVVMANSDSSDLTASRILDRLEAVSGQALDVKGYGGEKLRERGVESELDVSQFMDKGFHTFRKTKVIHESQFQRYSPMNLINKHWTRNVNDQLHVFQENNIGRKLFNHEPSVILSVDNEFMMFQVMDELQKYYAGSSVPRPQRHFYSRWVKDMRQFHLKTFDFMHYTIPNVTALADGFRFPAQYVGQYGVYETIRKLFSEHPASKSFVGPETVSISKRHFASQLEAAVTHSRTQFREAHGMSEDTTLVFVNLGNQAQEVEWCYENVRKGVDEFLLKYSAPTSLSPIAKPKDKFHTVISVQNGSSGKAKFEQLLSERDWAGDYTVVDEDSRTAAMAASDFGVSFDGMMVSEAAACQLPVMVLLNMRMHHQWYHDLFNRWANNMNLIADRDIYPELIGGQAWFGKICDSLGQWYVTPKSRYDLIQKWEHILKEAMPRADGEQPMSRVFGEIVLGDDAEYEEFTDPFNLIANKLWGDMQAYEGRQRQVRADNLALF